MASYEMQFSKVLNRADLRSKYSADDDYTAGTFTLNVELLPRETVRNFKKAVTESKRSTSKTNISDLTLEASTGLLYRTIDGKKRYINYQYDFLKVGEGFKLSGSFKAASRAALETQMGKFFDIANDQGNITFTWHNLTFSTNITSMTMTETTKKMGFAMDYEIIMILGIGR